jgi:hypothetical protein
MPRLTQCGGMVEKEEEEEKEKSVDHDHLIYSSCEASVDGVVALGVVSFDLVPASNECESSKTQNTGRLNTTQFTQHSIPYLTLDRDHSLLNSINLYGRLKHNPIYPTFHSLPYPGP